MSTIELSRAEYAAAVECAEEELEPIPAIALAAKGTLVTPFHLALPVGDGSFRVSFDIEALATVTAAAIRYGAFAPVFRPLFPHMAVEPGDIVTLTYFPGSHHAAPQYVGG